MVLNINTSIAKLLFLTLFVFFIFNPTKSQVTIGSRFETNKGALLDLKIDQKNDGSNNSTKGLLLPRVNLTDMNQLYPMFITGSSTDKYKLEPGGPDYDKETEDANHIGLVVFNMNPCLKFNGNNIGIYIWSGSEWNNLSKKYSSDVKIFTDLRDGEKYEWRNFGAAGDWMLENMRARTYAQGGTPPILKTQNQDGTDYSQKYWCYPGVSGDGTNDEWYKQQKTVGLLYSWAAALNIGNGTGEIVNIGDINQGQGDSDELKVGVQGICPVGWHIPSDKEWNDLEREIYQNASKYSTYTSNEVISWNNTTPWDSAWETGLGSGFSWRPSSINKDGDGAAMKAQCPLFGTTHKDIGGKSLAASEGGFAAMLIGCGTDGAVQSWGLYSYFWSGSSCKTSIKYPNKLCAWYRGLGLRKNDYTGIGSVDRLYYPRDYLFSVRCKKN